MDWDGDGVFANAHANVTGNLVALPVAVRGRNYGDQITGAQRQASLRPSCETPTAFTTALTTPQIWLTL